MHPPCFANPLTHCACSYRTRLPLLAQPPSPSSPLAGSSIIQVPPLRPSPLYPPPCPLSLSFTFKHSTLPSTPLHSSLFPASSLPGVRILASCQSGLLAHGSPSPGDRGHSLQSSSLLRVLSLSFILHSTSYSTRHRLSVPYRTHAHSRTRPPSHKHTQRENK